MQVSPFLLRGKIMNETTAGLILTTDGIPLKVSLQKSEKKKQNKSFSFSSTTFIFYTFYILNSYRRYAASKC